MGFRQILALVGLIAGVSSIAYGIGYWHGQSSRPGGSSEVSAAPAPVPPPKEKPAPPQAAPQAEPPPAAPTAPAPAPAAPATPEPVEPPRTVAPPPVAKPIPPLPAPVELPSTPPAQAAPETPALVMPRKPLGRLAAWNYSTSVETFVRIGDRNPATEQLVVDALAMWADSVSNDNQNRDEALAGCEKAIAAGSKDPLLHYSLWRIRQIEGQPGSTAKLHEACKQLKESKYDASRRCYAMLVWGSTVLREDMNKARTLADEALKILPEALADRTIPASIIEGMYDMHTLISVISDNGDRMPGFKKFEAILKSARPNSALLSQITGRFYLDYSQDGRGTGFADTVTKEGWQKNADRTAVAEKALLDAWQKDPTQASTAAMMISVLIGNPRPRSEVEMWFQRAIKADSRSTDAYIMRWKVTTPRWGGHPGESFRFGNECLEKFRADRNAPVVLAEILVSSHEDVAGKGDEYFEYWKRPAVWPDIKKCYDLALERRPSRLALSIYAKYAVLCEKWVEADRLFRALDGKPAYIGFALPSSRDGRKNYEAWLEKVRKHVEPTDNKF